MKTHGCVLVAGPVSGGAANPARALGPVIVSLKFYSVWAYVFGPMVGGRAGCCGLRQVHQSRHRHRCR